MVRLGWQPVPELLRPYVTSLVAYDVDLGAPGVHRGLPSTIADLRAAARRAAGRGLGRTARRRAERLVDASPGCTPRPRRSTTTAPSAASSSALTTAGARALLGRAGRRAGGRADSTSRTSLPDLADLPERLDELAAWEERIALVVARALTPGAGPQRRGASRGPRWAGRWPG